MLSYTDQPVEVTAETTTDDKPNALYREAYQLLDEAKQQADLDKAISTFKASDSFYAYYALGELYRDGRMKTVNKIPIVLDADASLAAQFFLKAYESYKEKIKVIVKQSDSLTSIAHQDIQLTHVEALSKKAEKSHAEALYQLACFFQAEQTNHSQKKTSLMPETLAKFEKACLVAAADLFHPHAAYLLALKSTAADERLRYSNIAADPYFALQLSLKESHSLIEIRGDRPIPDSITLEAPTQTLPNSLIQRRSVLCGRIGGLYSSTSQYQKMASILPTTYPSSALSQSLGGKQDLSQDEMKQLRAARFGRLK